MLFPFIWSTCNVRGFPFHIGSCPHSEHLSPCRVASTRRCRVTCVTLQFGAPLLYVILYRLLLAQIRLQCLDDRLVGLNTFPQMGQVISIETVNIEVRHFALQNALLLFAICPGLWYIGSLHAWQVVLGFRLTSFFGFIVPAAGFEPTTGCESCSYSTAELSRRSHKNDTSVCASLVWPFPPAGLPALS